MNLDEIKFDERGLAPAVVQDARTGELLTLAYVTRESLERTIETGETWFWSRSRGSLWHKGETSGNTQRVVSITLDCDNDALRLKALPVGPACHTGATSCFYQDVYKTESEEKQATASLGTTLEELFSLIETRKRSSPEGSYTAYLFREGLDKILKKLGEESSETIIAAKNADQAALVREASDLLYHLLVLLVERGVTLDAVNLELLERRRSSEK